MINRIRYTSILCYALICEINLTILIQSNVLKKSVTLNCIVNIRLGLFVKVNNLSIAATLEVEYTVVIPTMLIVTDQETLRICRKCSLTCSGQTEEDCCVLAVHVCISRAVHRSHTLKWEIVVHHREHTLLHLTAVPCIDDNLLTACDVKCYCCLRV